MNKILTRIFAAMLVLVCLFTLAACGGTASGKADATTPADEEANALEPTVGAPAINAQLTWESLNSFPIKTSDMTIAEARQLCVEYFRFYKNALWTPSADVSFVRNSGGSTDSVSEGHIYGGLPYIGLGSGTLYRLMDYMDEETGVVDMHRALKTEDFSEPISMAGMKYFGNQCANGAFGGWGRVINTITSISTANMTHAQGCLRLGPYTYDQEKWAESARTTAVLEANGAQTMYESYALLQPADGLVYYTTAGHVIMCVSDAVVVRNDDNTINGDESYIYIIDQGQSWMTLTNDSGDTFQHKDNLDEKRTFTDLYNGNYAPFTFAEWLGTDPIEDTEVSFSHTGSKITWTQLMSSTVYANYAVSDIYAILTNDAGEEVYRHVTRSGNSGNQSLKFVETGINTDCWGTLTEGTWNIEIVAQLGTGERPTVYVGTLIV